MSITIKNLFSKQMIFVIISSLLLLSSSCNIKAVISELLDSSIVKTLSPSKATHSSASSCLYDYKKTAEKPLAGQRIIRQFLFDLQREGSKFITHYNVRLGENTKYVPKIHLYLLFKNLKLLHVL